MLGKLNKIVPFKKEEERRKKITQASKMAQQIQKLSSNPDKVV